MQPNTFSLVGDSSTSIVRFVSPVHRSLARTLLLDLSDSFDLSETSLSSLSASLDDLVSADDALLKRVNLTIVELLPLLDLESQVPAHLDVIDVAEIFVLEQFKFLADQVLLVETRSRDLFRHLGDSAAAPADAASKCSRAMHSEILTILDSKKISFRTQRLGDALALSDEFKFALCRGFSEFICTLSLSGGLRGRKYLDTRR